MGRARREPDTTTYEGRIAARLGVLLRRAKKSPAELADSIGVTEGAVGHWLSGRRTPPIEKFPAIASALGLSSTRQILPE